MATTVIVNGEQTEQISVFDRGLAYGDGIFETILCVNRRLLLWQQHLQRLDGALVRLQIQPYDSSLLQPLIQPYLNTSTEQVVKIIVTRGVSQRGYAIPESATPNTVIFISDRNKSDNDWSTQGIKAQFCETRLGYQTKLAGLKHLNRLEQILAQQELAQTDCQEGIMLGQQGEVIDATMHNLFLVKNGELFTPDLTNCGVAGIMRTFITEYAHQQEIPVHISRIEVEQLMQADEIFLTNSINGIWPICELGGTRLAIGEVTCLLKDKVVELIHSHD